VITLRSSPAHVLIAYFVETDLLEKWASATRQEWASTVGVMPDGQNINDNFVTAYNTGTYYQGRYMSGDRPDKFNVQLAIRSKDQTAGYAKGAELQQAMDDVVRYNLVINSTNSDLPSPTEVVRIDCINTYAGLTAVGQEEKNRRFRHVINVRLTLTGADEI
jgi:hypothetical protein